MGWGLWGRVEVEKLLHTAGERAPRSRGAGGTRRWSGAAARKREKWSQVLVYQVSGGDRADPDFPLVPDQRVQAVRSCFSLSPPTQDITSLAFQGCLPPAAIRLAKC